MLGAVRHAHTRTRAVASVASVAAVVAFHKQHLCLKGVSN